MTDPALAAATDDATSSADIHAAILADVPFLCDLAQTLWDMADVHPDTAVEACNTADYLREPQRTRPGVLTTKTLTLVRELGDLLAYQPGMDEVSARRAAGVAFLASFCITNADLEGLVAA